MKIALVAQNATPLHPRVGSGPDSDDIGLSELTRRLAGQGHQVTVYAQKHQPDLPDRAELHDGVRVEHINAGPVPADSGDASLLERVPAFSGPLRSCWEQDRPDVVHALRWTSGLAALAAARDQGIPVVQEFSSLGVTERRDRVRADGSAAARIRLEPAIGRSATAVVATHSAEVPELASLGVHRSSIRVIPWGVDTDMFTPEGPVAERNGRPRLLTAADLKAARGPGDAAAGADQGSRRRAAGRRRPGPRRTARRRRLPRPGRLRRHAGRLRPGDFHRQGRAPRDARPAAVGRPGPFHLPVRAVRHYVAAGHGVRHPGHRASGGRSRGRRGGRDDRHPDPAGPPALLAQRIRQLLAHPMLLEAYGVAAADRVRSRYSWDRIAGETLAVYDKAAALAA